MIELMLMGDHPYKRDLTNLSPLRFRAGAFSINPSTYHSSMGNYMKGRNNYVRQTMDAFGGKLPISICPILFCHGNPLDN